jgi:hypothetical protein
MIISLRDAKRLRRGLNQRTARDIFWRLTGRDVYRMLVRERRWSPRQDQESPADTKRVELYRNVAKHFD